MRNRVLAVVALYAAALAITAGIRPATGAGARLVVPSDLYPTIQSALDAVPDGGTVAVGAGTYNESLKLTGRTGVTLAGKKAVVDSDGAEWTLWLEQCTGVVVTGFTFREGGKAGVLFRDCAGGSISRCVLEDHGHVGLLLDGSDGVTVSSCQVRDAGTNGISGLAGTTGTTVSKCVVEDVGGEGIYILGSADAGSARTVIAGNSVARTGGNGIRTGGAGFLLAKNRVSEVGGDCIHVDSETVASSDVSISGNRLTGGSRSILLEASACAVTKNRIAAGSFGMVLSGDGHLVSGNSMTGTSSGGVTIHASGCTVEKNKVADSYSRGYFISTGPNQVSRCSARNCANGAFWVFGSGTTLTGNKAKGCGEPVARDHSPPGANTWTGNRFAVTYVP